MQSFFISGICLTFYIRAFYACGTVVETSNEGYLVEHGFCRTLCSDYGRPNLWFFFQEFLEYMKVGNISTWDSVDDRPVE